MQSLSRSLTRLNADPISLPWPSLTRYIRPQKGTLVLIAGQPGGGKSALALNLALKSDHYCTYLSLDTALGDQAMRSVAILKGLRVNDVEERADEWAKWLATQETKVRVYDQWLPPEEIGELLDADTEFWGREPDLLFVDNLSDLAPDGGYEGTRSIVLCLRQLARTRGICVVGLHHTKRPGFGEDATSVPNLRSLLYAGEREAEMVLGIRTIDTLMDVAILKNRSGVADPTGNLTCRLRFDKKFMDVRELIAYGGLQLIK